VNSALSPVFTKNHLVQHSGIDLNFINEAFA